MGFLRQAEYFSYPAIQLTNLKSYHPAASSLFQTMLENKVDEGFAANSTAEEQ